MKIIEFWDRKSPINGTPASEVLKDNFFNTARKLFLIKDDITSIVYNIESVDIIRTNLDLNTDYTDEEVAEMYLNTLENPIMMLNETSPEITLENLQLQINDMNAKLDLILSKLG